MARSKSDYMFGSMTKFIWQFRLIPAIFLVVLLSGSAFKGGFILQSHELEDAQGWAAKRYAAYKEIGNILYNLGEYDASSAAYDAAMGLGESHQELALTNKADLYVNKAVAENALGKIESAIFYLIKAKEINPQFALARKNLALVYYKQGKLEDAIAEQKQYLKLLPESKEAKRDLAVMIVESFRKKEDVSQENLNNEDIASLKYAQRLFLEVFKLDSTDRQASINAKVIGGVINYYSTTK